VDALQGLVFQNRPRESTIEGLNQAAIENPLYPPTKKAEMAIAMTRSFFTAVVLTITLLCGLWGAPVFQVTAEENLSACGQGADLTDSKGVLKILTLNVAHGRKGAINQIFLSKKKIQQNLLEISDMIKRENADVVALQEADGASKWSGNFDHVTFIADRAGYPWFHSAAHATSWLFTYGTAILSRLPVTETIEHAFRPSPPTFNKGFVLGRVMWKPDPEADPTITIDIVSVHLDFSRKKVRQEQIIEMADMLSTRSRPMIILGDFNSEWLADDSVVKRLADKAHMKVYQPDARNLQTYLKRGKRLDWILISEELNFVSHKVLPDVVSDHQAVVATVVWIQS
jgi:endonuclease/exonuclease/phosphatase family metal-dependent hydrolase